MVVNPPAMFPLVGWDSERSLVLFSRMKSLYEFQVSRNFCFTSGVAARSAQTCSAPVNSEVSPKQSGTPKGSSLSIRLPTVGFDASPEVVSDSPHLTEIQRSSKPHSSRWISLAQCMNSLAFQEALAMVSMSPLPSMENPSTGLPVAAMPSTTFCVHPGSIPITTTAATFGFFPVPMIVRKNSSRSAPN